LNDRVGRPTSVVHRFATSMKYEISKNSPERRLRPAMLISGDCPVMCSIERRATVSVGGIGGGDVMRI